MRHRNKGAGVLAVILGLFLFFIVIVAVLIGWYIRGYNRAVRLEQGAQTAWANVESTLQRRMDLIPNLVETVKGYATHERELFENIAQARTQYFQAKTPAGKMEAAQQVNSMLSRLLLLVERYPELKASQNFLALQDALEGTENRINVERMRYNEAVRQVNTYCRELVGSFFCRQAGVEPMEPFEAAPEARQAPRVDFGTAQPQPTEQPAEEPVETIQ